MLIVCDRCFRCDCREYIAMITTNTTMQTLSFDELYAQTNITTLQQHYVTSLHGSVLVGETVVLTEEVILTDALRSKVATVIRKEAPSGFLVNFYVYAGGHDAIQVPRLPVPRKRTYIGFPTQEVLQTNYVSVVPDDSVQDLALLVNEDDVLSGRKAFCIGMLDCYFLRLRINTDLTLDPIGVFWKPPCHSLTQQTWSVRLKLYRVIMEALNTKSLNSAYRRHKTIDFSEAEWRFFSNCFGDPPVERKGTVTLRVNRLDGSKESCKVKTKKYTRQFTTSDDITMLKTVLGGTITVSTRAGFPTAPKRLRATDEYLFSKQTAGNSEYVNAIVPCDDDNPPTGYYFLWTEGTEKLRVTTQWERMRITHPLVRAELRRTARGEFSDDSASLDAGRTEIQIGDDFSYDQAQFEVQKFVGESHVRCVVIESHGHWLVGRLENFRIQFVSARMLDNY
jgi:hypothetical protein